MKLKDTLKLMSISLFQYQLVFTALEDLSLVDLLYRTSVGKVIVEYFNLLKNSPCELSIS